MRSLTLAFAMLPLVTVPTLAAPCQVEELQKKVAALPDFVVVKKGEKSLDALSRALGCELPAPQLPTLASGEKIKPAVMIGKNIFSAEGKNSEGVIKDVVVDKENLTVSSVIKLTPALGAGYVTFPVNGMNSVNGGFSLADKRNTSLATAAASYPNGKSVSRAFPPGWCVEPPLVRV
jgi:hypothetical protein